MDTLDVRPVGQLPTITDMSPACKVMKPGYPRTIVNPKIREAIRFAEEKMRTDLPDFQEGNQDDCPLKHVFGDGLYIREIFMPKGKILSSKIHRLAHPFFIMRGLVTVLDEAGTKIIRAPYHGMTAPGTKRLLYIHEDTVWITVHVSNETDVDKIEDEIIAKTFDDVLPPCVIEMKKEGLI